MTRNNLYVPVEWKAAGGGAGELEGYASVFGNVDRGGDVVMPGAFRKTIADWRRAAQPMPLIADHDLTTSGIIGSLKDIAEKAHGLWFKAGFSRSDKAQRIRQDVLDGHYRGTSFTYEVIRQTPGHGMIGGKSVARFLDEVRLFEVTLTPFPMNELAGVVSAKAEAEVDTKALDDWLDSMGHALGIKNPLALKAAVDQLVRGYPTDDLAADPGDAPATATDAATTPEAGDTSNPDHAYALSILHGPPDGAPTGEPPDALPGPLADLEQQRSIADIAALEADIQRALEG